MKILALSCDFKIIDDEQLAGLMISEDKKKILLPESETGFRRYIV